MVPSPDWFIGIDGFDLCINGKWLDRITIEVIIEKFYYAIFFSYMPLVDYIDHEKKKFLSMRQRRPIALSAINNKG